MKIHGLSRQVVSHGSGLSRQVSLYHSWIWDFGLLIDFGHWRFLYIMWNIFLCIKGNQCNFVITLSNTFVFSFIIRKRPWLCDMHGPPSRLPLVPLPPYGHVQWMCKVSTQPAGLLPNLSQGHLGDHQSISFLTWAARFGLIKEDFFFDRGWGGLSMRKILSPGDSDAW